MTHEFRYKDWTDYKSSARDQAITPTDQLIGTGDNSQTQFQLIKKYVKGALSNTRTIKKPVSGTVVIALDDVPQGSGWSVDTATGIVTFTTPPGASVAVRAGFEFDVPCRFDMKRLETSWVAWEAGRQDAVVKEVRL